MPCLDLPDAPSRDAPPSGRSRRVGLPVPARDNRDARHSPASRPLPALADSPTMAPDSVSPSEHWMADTLAPPEPVSRSAAGQDAATQDLDRLLTEVAAGDRRAFESLYRATSSRLFGICLRVLHERADAEDVLQDVYTTIWNKAGQYDAGRANAMAWLAMIARNRAIDRIRATPARGSQADIEVAEAIADAGPSPLQTTEAADDRARLEHCMRQLEPKRQGLIRAAFFGGATYEELAQRSGSPLGSVKSWIRRGLLQLRGCLEA